MPLALLYSALARALPDLSHERLSEAAKAIDAELTVHRLALPDSEIEPTLAVLVYPQGENFAADVVERLGFGRRFASIGDSVGEQETIRDLLSTIADEVERRAIAKLVALAEATRAALAHSPPIDCDLQRCPRE